MSQPPKCVWSNNKKTTAWKHAEGNFYLSNKCDIAHPVTWVRMLGIMSRYVGKSESKVPYFIAIK